MPHNNNHYYLSRHWEAESNVLKILSHTVETWKRFPLTQKGIIDVTEEAKNTEVIFDFIFTSPILRVRQTAEIYQKYLGGIIYEDSRLIERNDGIFDGKTLDEYLAWYNENDRDLTTDSPENGENHTDLKNRVLSLIDELETRFTGKNILLVSHGTPCAIMMNIWKGEDIPTKNYGVIFPKNKIIKMP